MLSALDAWVQAATGVGRQLTPEKDAIKAAFKRWRADVPKDKEEALAEGRAILRGAGDIMAAALLVADAERDGNEVARAVAERFVHVKLGGAEVKGSKQKNWHAVSKEDKMIAFDGNPSAEGHPAKL